MPNSVRFTTLLTAFFLSGIWTISSHAENRRFDVPLSSAVGSIVAADSTCEEFISFSDSEFLMTTLNRVFNSTGLGFTINGSSRIQLNVDPASGASSALPWGLNRVSIESGQFFLRGSSPQLGANFVDFLRGRIVGFRSVSLAFDLEFVIDIDFVHPSLAAVAGPINTVVYRTAQDTWPGQQLAPWRDDLLLDPVSCFSSGPDIFLFAETIPAPNPVVFETTGMVSAGMSSCLFEEPGDEPVTVQVTFDGNSQDANPDPNRGDYLSCDDSYGSRSGSVTRFDTLSFRSSCVDIRIDNNRILDGGEEDLFLVNVAGTGDVNGRVIGLSNLSGTAFVDDSLPTAPLTLGLVPDGFVTVEPTSTTLAANGSCMLSAGIDTFIRSGDVDSDLIADIADNCIEKFNPNQRDSNGDGYGNACDPDLNNDGVVNVADLGALRADFFARGDLDADFNSDGIVNILDFGLLREFFFSVPGPSGLRSE